MKKSGVLAVILVFALSACNNDGVSIKVKVDSVGRKFDTAAEKLYDSTKNKAKDLKNIIKDRFDKNEKDSVSNK